MSAKDGKEPLLRLAIESILNQTMRDFEFLIVNDGSQEPIAEVLREYQKRDVRVRIIVNPQNLGLTKSLNKAFPQAKGKYIARMDADDISEPNRLEKQYDFMEQNPEVVLCGSLGWVIDQKGERIKEKNLEVSYGDIKRKLLFNNQFLHSSLFIRKDVLDKEGFYSEGFFKAQDYELVLRLSAKYPVANLPDRLLKWRLDQSSLSWLGKKQQKYAIKARWWAITKYGYPKLEGIFHILLRLGWLLVPKWVKMKRYK